MAYNPGADLDMDQLQIPDHKNHMTDLDSFQNSYSEMSYTGKRSKRKKKSTKKAETIKAQGDNKWNLNAKIDQRSKAILDNYPKVLTALQQTIDDPEENQKM
jgi:hypothetical protein